MGKDEGKAEQQLGTKGFIHKISDLCFGLKKKRTGLREKNMLFCCLPSPKPSWFHSNAPAQIGHDTAQGDDHRIRGVIARGTRLGCRPLALATWQGGAHKAPSCYQKLPTTSAAMSCAGHSTHLWVLHHHPTTTLSCLPINHTLYQAQLALILLNQPAKQLFSHFLQPETGTFSSLTAQRSPDPAQTSSPAPRSRLLEK